MELRQIKYFIEVAKREHVTEAADALHVAQSAVSRQIFNLEEELGVDLFIRKGRTVKLTPVGKVFLERMIHAMNVIDNATQVVNEYLDPEKGVIHIGFPSSLTTYILPTAISAFRERYPDVQFSLSQYAYRGLTEAVASGDVNIALLGPVPTNLKDMEGTVLFNENMVALLPANHPLANKSSIALYELKEDSFVLFPEGFILRELVVKACMQIGFEPKVSFEGEDIDTIKGLVSAGLGVSIIPEITLVDTLPRETVMIPIKEPKFTRTVGMVVPTNRQLLPTEKLFYDFLQNYFAHLENF
ncbi:LysR family transcriptional regulator [Ornithinibacillus sp. 4-3]|uniref:LysR family transcriptional regulator n=1 Tax=Ornithinibacillus sp. 4-3 TaxID=3231488 RepID=A0AB39HRW5_9BACI